MCSNPPESGPECHETSSNTVSCFLCGSTQLHARYRNHLALEHGVVHEVEFLVQVSLHKHTNSSLPNLLNPGSGPALRLGLSHSSSQTESSVRGVVCAKCTNEDKKATDDNEHKSGPMCSVWPCTVCPQVYSRRYHHDQHMVGHHQWTQDQLDLVREPVSLTEQEFNDRQRAATLFRVNSSSKKISEDSRPDKSYRRAHGETWGASNFSTRYTCLFCLEEFKRDHSLGLHLALEHKEEPVDLMERARHEMTVSRLDGCLHQCKLCSGQFRVAASFARHVRDQHQLTSKQYKEQFGESEVETATFTCRLCRKELKHTRNILMQHMKQVHLISWQEYLARVQQYEEAPLPAPVMFNCGICDSQVKMKSQHLIKQHDMEEEVYDLMEAAGNMVDKVKGSSTCDICQRVCMDLARHLKMSHKLTREEYISTVDVGTEENFESEGENFESTPLPTDLRCYFDCGEVFKKDYQLKLHLKLKHSKEDPEELVRAGQAAQQEIELTRRSGGRLQCALCPVVLSSKSSLWSHVTSKHNVTYQAYKAEHGVGEQGEQPVFKCRICHRSLKHDRCNVARHLTGLHGITWAQYVGLVRGEGAGLDSLPAVQMEQCKICGNTVKYIKAHLKNTHNITMEEYENLIENEGKGSMPEIELTKCVICNSTVKCFRDHLKKTHHITEEEYEEVLANEKTPPRVDPVKCEICEKDVKHLDPHLLRTHKMNMAQYRELVESKSGEAEVKIERGDKSPARVEEYLGLHNSENIKTENVNIDSNDSESQDHIETRKPSKAEIQDKTNTRCSTCLEEFFTRKKFVQHCQLVHQIKFKTKAGLAVPPPSESNFSSPEGLAPHNVTYRDADEKRLASWDLSTMNEAGTRGVKRSRLVKGEGSVQCDQCLKMFSTVSNMEKHKRLNCHQDTE